MFVIFTFLIAISLAAVAAAFSISGLMAIYPAIALGILIGAVVIEIAKLTAVSYVYQFYEVLGVGKKFIAGVFIVATMLITSLGVYGHLSKGYLEQLGPLSEYSLRIENIEETIDGYRNRISQNQRQIGLLDDALQGYIDRGVLTRGMQVVREDNREDYERLQAEVQEYRGTIEGLNTERLELRNRLARVEAEVGPIQYIADLFFGEGENSRDRALQWFSILIAFSIDPFAIALLWFANHAYAMRNDPRVRREFGGIFDKPETNDTIGNSVDKQSYTVEDKEELLGKVKEFLDEKELETETKSSKTNESKYQNIIDEKVNSDSPSKSEAPKTETTKAKKNTWISGKKG